MPTGAGNVGSVLQMTSSRWRDTPSAIAISEAVTRDCTPGTVAGSLTRDNDRSARRRVNVAGSGQHPRGGN